MICKNGHDKEAVGTYGSRCKSCHQVSMSKYSPKYLPRKNALQRIRRDTLAYRQSMSRTALCRLYMRYDCIVYLGGTCVDCGYNNHLDGFEFDHVPEKGQKLNSVSRLIRGAYDDWEAIKAELDKCELVCGTCHNIRTAARLQTARATTILPMKGSERLLAI